MLHRQHDLKTGTTFMLAESMLDMLDAIAPDQDKRFLLTRHARGRDPKISNND